MKVSRITMSKKKAAEEWRKYNTLLKQKEKAAEKYLKELKAGYYHMMKGKKLIDIYEVFKQTGLNKGLPKLAIARADLRKIYFRKNKYSKRCCFSEHQREYHEKVSTTIYLPQGIFEFRGKDRDIVIEAPVPIVPIDLLPKGKLSNYYVLWEVDIWKPEPPHDPILLKKISKNLFIILAGWNLTKLEKAIVRGRSHE